MSKTGHSYEQLETAFRHRNLKPLYFLFGEEPFLTGELQALLIQHALSPPERDFNLDIVYGAEAEAQAVLGLCASYPIMSEWRVVVVRDFDKLKDNRMFTAYAERPNPQAVVLLACSAKPNLSTHPYRALREHAVWAEFKPLHASRMPGWIQGRIRMQGCEIEAPAAQMLAEFVGNNLQAAATEIDKLITYAGGRTKLTGDDVVHAVGQTREFNVFELQRAIGERRYTDAMRITERLLRQSSNARGEALMVISVLTGYFTKLWKLSAIQAKGVPEQQIAARIGVSPYYVKEYIAGLRRMGSGAVREAFSTLLAADYELKGGSGRDEWLIMTLVMRKLIPGRAPAQSTSKLYA